MAAPLGDAKQKVAPKIAHRTAALSSPVLMSISSRYRAKMLSRSSSCRLANANPHVSAQARASS
eukprot:11210202-Lingulodinium_polyedra.AAC.1